jgi:hypothetical integral membrane protein (TIGR02206 family)
MTTPLDLSTEHLAALATAATASTLLCAAAHRWPGRWTRLAGAALGAVTAGAEVAWIAWLVRQGAWNPAIGLPLQLCDAATFLAAAALWTRRRGLVEVLWFWAMAGTLQALLTPDVPDRYPGFLWFQYYVAHGGIVAAAVFLVVGLRLTPRRGAALRVAALTAAYAAAAGAVDLLTGGDYLYLRRPPLRPSLLDVMGPWPWYLLSATALAIVLFALLQAPFASGRRGRAQVLPPEVERQRPRLAGRLVRLVRRVELGARQEAVPQARVDLVPEVHAGLREPARQLGDVVHADALVLVAPEAEDGAGHAVGQLQRRRP